MIIHFSVDDCIEIFRDITDNDYKSIFESPYFSFFKLLHDKYDAHISLYTFVEYNGFNISKVSKDYKYEFKNNANWLKIGFHSFNAESKYNIYQK